MCHLYPYKNVKLLWKFFYNNICGFIGRGKFLYETPVLDSIAISNIKFNEITAGGIKIRLEGPVPLDAP